MRNYLIAVLMVLLLVSFNACGDEDSPCGPCSKQLTQLTELTAQSKGGQNQILSSLTLEIVYNGTAIKLPDLLLTHGMQGDMVLIDASQAGVGDFFANLANGTDEVLDFRFHSPNGYSFTRKNESDWIAGGVTGNLQPDLDGTNITKMLLYLDRVYINSPGEDVNGDGQWTSWDFLVRLEIWGTL